MSVLFRERTECRGARARGGAPGDDPTATTAGARTRCPDRADPIQPLDERSGRRGPRPERWRRLDRPHREASARTQKSAAVQRRSAATSRRGKAGPCARSRGARRAQRGFPPTGAEAPPMVIGRRGAKAGTPCVPCPTRIRSPSRGVNFPRAQEVRLGGCSRSTFWDRGPLGVASPFAAGCRFPLQAVSEPVSERAGEGGEPRSHEAKETRKGKHMRKALPESQARSSLSRMWARGASAAGIRRSRSSS